jgi:hypothetical protein
MCEIKIFEITDGVACTKGLDADGHHQRIRATPRDGSTPMGHALGVASLRQRPNVATPRVSGRQRLAPLLQ